MKNIKSHFVFTKQQRNGILSLLSLIVVLQLVYFFVDFPRKEIDFDNENLEKFQKEIDSLKAVEIENSKPKVYPFNPNFISDHKGYMLGMSNEEIDRLLYFREQGKWVNSKEEFQQVTMVSDSLLNTMAPYFKFPDWVTNTFEPKSKFKKVNSPIAKMDLNKASREDLKKVNGIGEVLSKRIVEYRKTLPEGFISMVQLQEVYGLSPEVIERMSERFFVNEPENLSKVKLNTASRDELVTIKYIDYEIAHRIIEERTLREGFKSLEELTKVKDFPVHRFEIIKLYLTLN
ncbi:helix-hairpin-helix domain-containing protein [Mangrovimonas sp. TPBH4]|uniref:ComEA family DNA-binding protein n=1 Tax=Mangrovimonas sp. TPBH4 TaxID=1645914 RepID=UPI0006B51C07|nr:helix-hairpin-helix domain-containing protein [Mangrovimonas sp. TPBH4]